MAKPKISSGVVIAVQAVIIAVLITAVVAFIAGTRYQKSQQAEVKAAVTASTTEVKK